MLFLVPTVAAAGGGGGDSPRTEQHTAGGGAAQRAAPLASSYDGLADSSQATSALLYSTLL